MSLNTFNNYGFIEHVFTNKELQPIRDEIDEIQADFDMHQPQQWNTRLSGNLKREFALPKSMKIKRFKKCLKLQNGLNQLRINNTLRL